MRSAVYSPYLDTASGGEKYILTIAEALKELGRVDVLLDENLYQIGPEKIKSLNESRHSLNLKDINFIKAPIGIGSKIFERNKFLKNYDVLFYLSDGSIFYSTSKKSFIHIQMPLDNIQSRGFVNKLKLSSWKKVIYNSKFTKKEIEKKLKKSGEVVYPPIDIERFSNKVKTKKDIILNVGRFTGDGVKKQHVLIEGYKKMLLGNLKGWELHLAGALKDSDKRYFEELVGLSRDIKVIFHPNISYDDLTKLYLQAKIYWHGMGYQEDDPKKMEHFGITTVEAMAAGCVPVVINKGGQMEIVDEGEAGMLWGDLDTLVEKTGMLIGDNKLMERLSKNSILKAEAFSVQHFKSRILELVSE